ncbi:Alanine racemase [bioreactor metagenome]|uniref:Alanine racemase n=1 Tax=bioreactor metagenome TaxID=1076179 RepID=A0A645F6Y5_9ZZZZ
MDQTLVDVTGIPEVEQGVIAVLIGKSGEKEITACDLAEQACTITNEILSRMGGRLDRMFVP